MLLKSNIPVMYYFLLFRFLRYNATKTSRIFLEERKPFLLKFRFLCRYLKTYFEQLNKRRAFKIGEKIERKQIIIIKNRRSCFFFPLRSLFFFATIQIHFWYHPSCCILGNMPVEGVDGDEWELVWLQLAGIKVCAILTRTADMAWRLARRLLLARSAH